MSSLGGCWTTWQLLDSLLSIFVHGIARAIANDPTETRPADG